ncbi:MAG: S8 family serine peptidase, partial [Jatrophihabitantaceae bacterium]
MRNLLGGVAVTAAAISLVIFSPVAHAAPSPPVPTTPSSPSSTGSVAARHPAVQRTPVRPTAAQGQIQARTPVILGVSPAAIALPASPDGDVQVTVLGDTAQVRAQVVRLGGRVLVNANGASSAIVPKAKLAALGASTGVTDVQAPNRAFVQDTTSEGVTKSLAPAWQGLGTGQSGAGQTVAIVDAGFSNLAAEEAQGNLPQGLGVTAEPLCQQKGAVGSTQHGTAVAEIVHQMAPAATLVLYCVYDSVDFNVAANDIVAKGYKIASSSLGFPGDSRGDGSGSASSAAHAVMTARRAGVLWIQSAGNNAQEHWSGTLADSNGDGWVDIGCSALGLNPATTCPEGDRFHAPANSGVVTAVLKYDRWSVSTLPDVRLVLSGYDCSTN